jgi:type IV pilus assembly protein PilV
MLLTAENSRKTGFTLIEVMVAMLIMTIGLMALIQTLGNAIAHNFSNKLRNDAVMIADRAMMINRSMPFDAISSANDIDRVPFALGFVNYSVVKNVTKFGSFSSSKNVRLTVSWQDRRVRKQHSLTTIIGK